MERKGKQKGREVKGGWGKRKRKGIEKKGRGRAVERQE